MLHAAKSTATYASLPHTSPRHTKRQNMRRLCSQSTRSSTIPPESALQLGCCIIISSQNAILVLCVERRKSSPIFPVLISRHSSTQHLQLHLLQAHWDDVPDQLPASIFRLAYDACVRSDKAYTKQTALKYRSVVEQLPAPTAEEGYTGGGGEDSGSQQ